MLLLGLIVVAVVASAGALAHSRGFTGSISHAVDALTNPNAKRRPTPPAGSPPWRACARYWKEALQVFDAHPALGAGAMGYGPPGCATAGLRWPLRTHTGSSSRRSPTSGSWACWSALALLSAWMAAAGRATHPSMAPWAPWRAWRNLGSGRSPAPGWRSSPLP